jgi:hypothetical protein
VPLPIAVMSISASGLNECGSPDPLPSFQRRAATDGVNRARQSFANVPRPGRPPGARRGA